MRAVMGRGADVGGARVLAVTLAAVLALDAPAGAQDEPQPSGKEPPPPRVLAGVGELAPRLADVEWLLGKPVKQWTRGTTWIVVFFSAADPETLRTLELCGRLQRERAAQRVAVVGVATLDHPDRVPNAAFVERYGERLAFPVARDKLDKTIKAWDATFKLAGTPRVVLVDKVSRVAWSGHPFLDGLEAALDAVLSGEPGAVDEVLAARHQALVDIAALRAEHAKLSRLSGREARAAEVVGRMVAIDPALAAPWLAWTWEDLADAGLREEAAAWGARVVDELAQDDAALLGELAWAAVHPQREVRHHDTALAVRAARRAVELTGGRDGGLLDTLARALWLAGQRDDALRRQREAVSAAFTADERAALQKTLEQYERGS